jgi:hypothetical protein
VGRTLTRMRAWLHQLDLDEALGAAADPWSDPQLLLRASRLTSLENRRRLAEALEGIVTAAETGRHVSSYLRLRRRSVFEERDLLLTLAAYLRAPGPVPVTVLARLMLLLTHGSSPLFVGGRPAAGVATTVHQCVADLERSAV